MSSSSAQEFGRFRNFIWPIHRHELNKLLPLLGIFFFIALNYNILRNLKDTLVICTAKESGAEIIPFIKVWVMLPGAIIMTSIFTYLSRLLPREKVFYAIIGLFLAYFGTFVFLVYPIRDLLHPHATADKLQLILPEGAKGFIAMFRYWTFSSFYAMSELWGNIVIFLLFWAFANEVTQISEAKRFYGLLGLGANMASIIAGRISIFICHLPYTPYFPFGHNAWDQSLVYLISIVFFSGTMAMLLFHWFNRRILTDPRLYNQSNTKRLHTARSSLSLKESFRHLAQSRYLMSIAALVIGYNLVINLVEVIWKNQVHMLYPDPSDFTAYMNHIGIYTGIVATILALFVSGNAIRKYGWTFTALLTPGILLITGLGFFSFMFFKGSLTSVIAGLFGMTPLAMVILFGSMQNVLCRGAKFTVYDATKELAFVPLSTECKLKGKTAIDGIGTRLGKSGGSFIHQGLLMIFSTLAASAPYVAAIFLAIVICWILATISLGKQFNALVDKQNQQEASQEASEVETAKTAISISAADAKPTTEQHAV